MSGKRKRDEQLNIMLTEDEKDKIREIAENRGMDMSNYARSKLLEPIREAVV